MPFGVPQRILDCMNDLLNPVYISDIEGETVDLKESEITLRSCGTIVSGKGRARLRFRPRFTLTVEVHFSEEGMVAYPALSRRDAIEFRYAADQRWTRAIPTEVNVSGDDTGTKLDVILLPNPQIMKRGDASTPLSRMLTHIVNFPAFLTTGQESTDIKALKPNGGWTLIGRALLYDGLWKIDLQELPHTKELLKTLKKTAGFGITHIAEICRSDGRAFSAEDADPLVQDLYRFLSFAHGAWAVPILSVGFDPLGNRAYEDWGVRIGTPWEVHHRWFDEMHGNALAELFPGFRKLLHDTHLGAAANSALYWYLRSNRGGEGAGIDSGIILSQAALERLSSAYLETQRVSLPKRASAADYLRETLSRLEIPIAVPSSLAGLIDGMNQGCWNDGPAALTRVRNELVHPKNRLPFRLGHVMADTWLLGQWYTELILLRLSGFSGEYSNRLKSIWRGQVEKVPWAL